MHLSGSDRIDNAGVSDARGGNPAAPDSSAFLPTRLRPPRSLRAAERRGGRRESPLWKTSGAQPQNSLTVVLQPSGGERPRHVFHHVAGMLSVAGARYWRTERAARGHRHIDRRRSGDHSGRCATVILLPARTAARLFVSVIKSARAADQVHSRAAGVLTHGSVGRRVLFDPCATCNYGSAPEDASWTRSRDGAVGITAVAAGSRGRQVSIARAARTSRWTASNAPSAQAGVETTGIEQTIAADLGPIVTDLVRVHCSEVTSWWIPGRGRVRCASKSSEIAAGDVRWVYNVVMMASRTAIRLMRRSGGRSATAFFRSSGLS